MAGRQCANGKHRSRTTGEGKQGGSRHSSPPGEGEGEEEGEGGVQKWSGESVVDGILAIGRNAKWSETEKEDRRVAADQKADNQATNTQTKKEEHAV